MNYEPLKKKKSIRNFLRELYTGGIIRDTVEFPQLACVVIRLSRKGAARHAPPDRSTRFPLRKMYVCNTLVYLFAPPLAARGYKNKYVIPKGV